MLGKFNRILNLKFITTGDNIVGIYIVILFKTMSLACELHGGYEYSKYVPKEQMFLEHLLNSLADLGHLGVVIRLCFNPDRLANA